jgi:hypothetical protein
MYNAKTMKLPIFQHRHRLYSMPEWLERAKNDYLAQAVKRDLDDTRRRPQGRHQGSGIGRHRHRHRRRAAAHNMIDHFTERIPGCKSILGQRFYYDFYDTEVRSKLGTGSLA